MIYDQNTMPIAHIRDTRPTFQQFPRTLWLEPIRDRHTSQYPCAVCLLHGARWQNRVHARFELDESPLNVY